MMFACDNRCRKAVALILNKGGNKKGGSIISIRLCMQLMYQYLSSIRKQHVYHMER